MRLLVRTEVGLVVVLVASLLVAYIGLAVTVSGRDRLAGFLVLVLGVWAMVAAPVVHDRLHLERGEKAHASVGRGGRRPPWGRPGRNG